MLSIKELRTQAITFPEVSEEAHFEKTSFRVKKKIFATYDEKANQACLKLSEIDQNVFSIASKSSIYPVANKWGKQGWTIVEMNSVNEELFSDALKTAYCEVAPKKLVELLKLK